ncbi:MAG: glycosyltransferase, partial [Acidobacteria bacterium]|nr:glycosyltransferase [Acidobacteriota bacterium]
MRIAFLTTVLPGAEATGGEVVSTAFVRALRGAGHDVEIIGYRREGYHPAPGEVAVATRTIETARAGWAERLRWAATAVARHQPLSSAKYASATLRRGTEVAVASAPDLVIVDHAQLGFLADLVPMDVPLVLIAHNVEHELYAEGVDEAAGLRRGLLGREARLVLAQEAALVGRASQVWALTAADATALAGFGGEVRSFPIPGAVAPRTGDTELEEATVDVAILGTWSWGPNAVGLRWFVDEVVPHLAPGRRIDIAGPGADW